MRGANGGEQPGDSGSSRAAGSDGSANPIDPVEAGKLAGAGAEPSGGTAQRRNRGGRPPGSRNATSGAGAAGAKKSASLDLSSTLAILQGIHTGLAYFGGPHWLLDDEDGKRYAQAVANVARHYDIEVAQKTVDWLNLLGIAAYIEGTRFLHGRMGQRQPQRPRQAGQVVPIFSFQ